MEQEGQKALSQVKQRKYSRDFSHVAPEIVGGIRGQSVANDKIFSLANILDHFYKSETGTPSCLPSSGFEHSLNKNAKFGHLPSSETSFSNITTFLLTILFYILF